MAAKALAAAKGDEREQPNIAAEAPVAAVNEGWLENEMIFVRYPRPRGGPSDAPIGAGPLGVCVWPLSSPGWTKPAWHGGSLVETESQVTRCSIPTATTVSYKLEGGRP